VKLRVSPIVKLLSFS